MSIFRDARSEVPLYVPSFAQSDLLITGDEMKSKVMVQQRNRIKVRKKGEDFSCSSSHDDHFDSTHSHATAKLSYFSVSLTEPRLKGSDTDQRLLDPPWTNICMANNSDVLNGNRPEEQVQGNWKYFHNIDELILFALLITYCCWTRLLGESSDDEQGYGGIETIFSDLSASMFVPGVVERRMQMPTAAIQQVILFLGVNFRAVVVWNLENVRSLTASKGVVNCLLIFLKV